MNWVVYVYESDLRVGAYRADSFGEAVRFARHEILGEKNDNMNIEWRVQTRRDDCEIDFAYFSTENSPYKAGIVVQIIRGDRDTHHWENTHPYNQPRPELTEIAATLGRKGGSAKSEAKASAARENGKKGGRPRKSAE